MQRVNGVLKAVGVAGWFLVGLWGFLLSLKIIIEAAGFWGGLVAFILAPITFAFVPWYAGFALGSWTLLMVTYGGGFFFALVWTLGSHLSGDD